MGAGLDVRALSRQPIPRPTTELALQRAFQRPQPRGGGAIDPGEPSELEAVYADANAEVEAARTPAERLQVELLLRTRLIAFAESKPTSAYAPAVRLGVVRLARARLGHSDSLEQAAGAFDGEAMGSVP